MTNMIMEIKRITKKIGKRTIIDESSFQLVCTPVLAYIAGNYLLDDAKAISAGLFMVEGLQVNLYLMCNIAVAAIVAAVFTEEYRGGQLRLLFLRQYSRARIFLASYS